MDSNTTHTRHIQEHSDTAQRASDFTPAKITLRTKIFIFTAFIILIIQALNCILEIGFLYRNLEQNSIDKYLIIGKEMKRKLETSMRFGKPLSQLNFQRLLEGILPRDLENFYITNAAGDIQYSTKPQNLNRDPLPAGMRTEKKDGFYRVIIPLEKKGNLEGHIISVIPAAHVQEKLIRLIHQSVMNSLVITILILPLLFVMLSLLIRRQVTNPISRISQHLVERNRSKLLETGINPDGLLRSEASIEQISSGEWIPVREQRFDKQFQQFSQDVTRLVAAAGSGQNGHVASPDVSEGNGNTGDITEMQERFSEHRAYEILAATWIKMRSKVTDK